MHIQRQQRQVLFHYEVPNESIFYINTDVYNGDFILIDDILDKEGPNGWQPTTSLGETQLTNPVEEEMDEDNEVHKGEGRSGDP